MRSVSPPPLLTALCSTSTSVVVLGDINIHVDTRSSHSAAELLQALDSVNLKQHVDVPTHQRGHTLDLVITDLAAPITNLLVYDLGVSDHMAVFFEMPFPSPHLTPDLLQEHQEHQPGCLDLGPPASCPLAPLYSQ